MNSTVEQQLYKIGAVSQKTGFSAERLRQWERRYGLEPAYRANRTRYYSTDQVAKLIQIRGLLRQGHTIGQLWSLSSEELAELYDTQFAPEDATSSVVVLVGPRVAELEANSASDLCEVARRIVSIEELEKSLDDLPPCDAFVVEIPSLDARRLEDLSNLLPGLVVAVYQFASKVDLEEAQQSNLMVYRLGEVKWSDLAHRLAETLQRTRLSGGGAVHFSEEELAHLSRTQTSGKVAPKDLVDIVRTQRALIEHIQRIGDCAFDVELAGIVQLSEAKMEEALKSLVDEYELFVEI